MRISDLKMPLCAVVSALAVVTLTPSVLAETIPSVTTLTGKTYEDVKVVSRQGDSVKIMHKAGVRTVSFKEFDRKTGMLLGLDEYEDDLRFVAKMAAQEKQLKEEAGKQVEAYKATLLKQLAAKKHKEFGDWVVQFLITDSVPTLDQVKAAVGRPPDAQTGDRYFWFNACWNPALEKLDTLILSSSVVPKFTGSAMIKLRLPVLECGASSLMFDDETRDEFAKKIARRSVEQP